MALRIDLDLDPADLRRPIESLFELSAAKILSLERTWRPADGTPVFTVNGRYTSRGWTEWTQGFQFGSALLQFDATDDRQFLELGRRGTLERMATHLSHVGVHDHGFNNVSTYGNLLRLLREGRLDPNPRERDCYELALRVSGAVQAARWTRIADGTGFIHSFNGPHSLFVDTLRSLRSLAVAHQLGHVLMGEQDARISLLRRLLEHALNTARYSIYYGEGRDAYDVRGRTAHEAIFNVVSGQFRCPNTQQGWSPFTTWTRGLAWAICGFAEQLEFLTALRAPPGSPRASTDAKPTRPRVAGRHHTTAAEPASRLQPRNSLRRLPTPCDLSGIQAPDGGFPGLDACLRALREAALATADFYLANTSTDGIPPWDTGAPNLHRLGHYLDAPADPFNAWEPVDSSAAAIAAQGLIRLGNLLLASRERPAGVRYRQAGLTVARTLFADPYLSTNPRHQGLILHSVYHRPNGWDHVAPGQHVPNGESSMWGDYHARELALLIRREIRGEPYLAFYL